MTKERITPLSIFLYLVSLLRGCFYTQDERLSEGLFREAMNVVDEYGLTAKQYESAEHLATRSNDPPVTH